MHDTGRTPEGRRDVASARMALIAGLALVALVGCLTLTGHPVSVASTNGVTGSVVFAGLGSDDTICQSGESLPQGTSAVRLSLFAYVGPRVRITVSSGRRTLARGERGVGWTTAAVTVPISRLRRPASGVTVCATVGTSSRNVLVLGQPSTEPATLPGHGPTEGRMLIEYLRPGTRSWWSSILGVARRMGLGHAFAGTWIVLLLAALMLCAIGIACRLLLSGLGRSCPASRAIPRAAWACALVACMNAACWSFLTPPFQAADEPSHYAYVELLANTGRLPSAGSGRAPEVAQEQPVLEALHFKHVRLKPEFGTIDTEAEQRQLDATLALRQPQTVTGVGVASTEPPLYYALETIPYELGSNVLTRLELMRLLSALFAGVSVLFVVLFMREALPGRPWAWTVGGLCAALTPLLGYDSGAVNPDALLTAVSAALFFCLARGLRRGLTGRLLAAIVGVMALGLLTKLNFVGLVPGALLGLAILAVRARRAATARAKRATRWLLLALAIVGVPAVAFVLITVLSGDPTFALVSRAVHQQRGSASSEIGYVWQFYLPRLPWMHDEFPGLLTTKDIWFDRLVGLYGWLDTTFPGWVESLALIPAALVGALCARALILGRVSLRKRAAELAVYGTMAVGELALVGIDSYIASRNGMEELYAEPRYLLPMLALMGAVLALAARGAGRRWLPVAGTLIVVAVVAHDLFSQLQVISRYYG